MTKIAAYLRDDSGATAIEYGLIASLIAVVIVTAARNLGSKITNTFNNINSSMP